MNSTAFPGIVDATMTGSKRRGMAKGGSVNRGHAPTNVTIIIPPPAIPPGQSAAPAPQQPYPNPLLHALLIGALAHHAGRMGALQHLARHGR